MIYDSTTVITNYNGCNCSMTYCPHQEALVEAVRRQARLRAQAYYTTSYSSVEICIPASPPPRSSTRLVNQRCSPRLFRPEHTLSRFTVMEKLRWLRLDERSTQPASPTPRSTRTTRRTPESSWPSALRRWSGRRS